MQELREFCLNSQIPALWQASMVDYTSFRIGGKADALLFPGTEEALLRTLLYLKKKGKPFRVIGNATNLLFSDSGFRGVLVTTRHIRSVSIAGSFVRAACGVPINALCRRLADESLGGIESLYGIPGTVGGAAFMNAGAFGTAVSDCLESLTVLDIDSGKTEVLFKRECEFSYRDSIFKKKRNLVILSAAFAVKRTEAECLREKMRKALSARMEKHPTALPSAGSVFLRHDGHSAGYYIEKAGLMGERIGGAAVSLKHAGFIVNLGGATAADVLALIDRIKERVLLEFGISLETEIEYIKE